MEIDNCKERVFFIKLHTDGYYYYEFVPKFPLDTYDYIYLKHKEFFAHKAHGGNGINLNERFTEMIWRGRKEMTEKEYRARKEKALKRLEKTGFIRLDYKEFKKAVKISVYQDMIERRFKKGLIYPGVFVMGDDICKNPEC